MTNLYLRLHGLTSFFFIYIEKVEVLDCLCLYLVGTLCCLTKLFYRGNFRLTWDILTDACLIIVLQSLIPFRYLEKVWRQFHYLKILKSCQQEFPLAMQQDVQEELAVGRHHFPQGIS